MANVQVSYLSAYGAKLPALFRIIYLQNFQYTVKYRSFFRASDP
jgi:hypothetical protein